MAKEQTNTREQTAANHLHNLRYFEKIGAERSFLARHARRKIAANIARHPDNAALLNHLGDQITRHGL